MKIGFLECEHISEKFQPAAGGNFFQIFTRLFEQYAPSLSLKRYDALNGCLPDSPGECDGYVCSGSGSTAFDDDLWVKQLRDFTRAVYEDDRKFVGICFGHQIISEALGGKVIRSPYGWGIGVYQVETIATKPWMVPPLDRQHLMFYHRDRVEKLPPNSTLLGSSDHCSNAMFTVGEHFLGIQGHPEVVPAYTEALLLENQENLGSDLVEAAKKSLSTKTDEAIVTAWIERFFRQ